MNGGRMLGFMGAGFNGVGLEYSPGPKLANGIPVFTTPVLLLLAALLVLLLELPLPSGAPAIGNRGSGGPDCPKAIGRVGTGMGTGPRCATGGPGCPGTAPGATSGGMAPGFPGEALDAAPALGLPLGPALPGPPTWPC